jgi:hypothetical protein
MSRHVMSDTGGVREILHIDDVDGTRGAIEVVQDVDACLKAARIARDAGADSKSKQLRAIAEIPMSVYLQAQREGWADDSKKWKQWLNDPANRDLRIYQGRV